MASSTIQGDLWGVYAEDWAYRTEPGTAALWRTILDECEVAPGNELLDLGCGGGGLAVLAAERGATVSGYDASESLSRIAARRVPSGDFQLGDLESLPYADASFDIVTACNSLQFCDDQKKAVLEARRVVKPGGKLAIGMWCEPERCEISAVFKVIQSTMSAPPPDKHLSLAVREHLLSLLASAGATVHSEGEVECVFEAASDEDAWLAMRAPGVMVSIARAIGEDRLHEAVMEGLAQFRTPSGGYRMANWFRYVLCS